MASTPSHKFLRNRIQRFSVAGNYTVTVWSGGKVIKTYNITEDRLYPEPDINGWSFYIKDKAVYVSGTVIIEEN